jgi:cytochrome P450
MATDTAPARTPFDDLARLRRMRDTQPVWRDPDSGDWHVHRYADVAAILADAHTFSSDFGAVFPDRADLMEGNIVAMDPPRHNQLRALVSQAFTPRAIDRLAGRIAELSEELLDQAASQPQLELVRDLAYPLPVTVIAELLGVPAEDRVRFKEWADALLDRDLPDRTKDASIKAAQLEIDKFHAYLEEHVARRRVEPRADLLTDLVAAEVDGARLSDAEIVGFATLLLLAGHITTTLLLGNAVLCLDEQPLAQAMLRADPSRVPSALEEVLRYRSPVPFTLRVTTREVQVGDQTIPPTQSVYVWLLSANHDERVFDAPECFDIGRQPNPHLAFGKGIHFCLGAPLARLEARIALTILLRRFSQIRVDPGYPIERYSRFNGVRTLHLLVERA